MMVNGEHMILQNKISINEFLKKENYDSRRIAVGKNGTIVPKTLYDTEMLGDDDNLEIVSFVGGG